MPTDRELMQQLLALLETNDPAQPLIQTIRARLAQPEQKQEWQAISDEELKTLLAECNMDDRFSHRMVAAVVQKKLKEKNYD